MNLCLCRRLSRSIGLYLLATAWPVLAFASQKNEARISRVVNDVQLVTAEGAPRPAVVSDEVRKGATVRTGKESRAELTFDDGTVARLSANTVLTIKNGNRDLDLKEGALLLEAPKNARGAKVSSKEVAVAITGTTVVFESYATHFKLLVLDGTGRLYRPRHFGDSVLVRAGQMVFGRPEAALSNPVDFDLDKFLKTSRFVTDFQPLRTRTLMANQIAKQQHEKSKKGLIDTNLVIFGGGTLVSLVDPAQLEAVGNGTAGVTAIPSPAPKATPRPAGVVATK
jgi:ferric-dicitrate binding protein FerR (iron transport regulator)